MFSFLPYGPITVATPVVVSTVARLSPVFVETFARFTEANNVPSDLKSIPGIVAKPSAVSKPRPLSPMKIARPVS